MERYREISQTPFRQGEASWIAPHCGTSVGASAQWLTPRIRFVIFFR